MIGQASPLKIAVVGNCQAPGIVAGLHALLPEATVEGWHFGAQKITANELLGRLGGFDVVVKNLPEGHTGGMFDLERLSRHCPTAVAIPAVAFTGFHPDIAYVFQGDQAVPGIFGDYHSAIIAAAWTLGLPQSRVPALFNSLVYARLGYFDAYPNAVQELLRQHREQEYEIAPHLDRWRAGGAFMYTINHPCIGVLSTLATMAAVRAGLVPPDTPPPAGVLDHLEASGWWPVYPELAQRIGVAGSTTFVRGRHEAHDAPREMTLPEAIEVSYRRYATTADLDLLHGRIAFVHDRLKEIIIAVGTGPRTFRSEPGAPLVTSPALQPAAGDAASGEPESSANPALRGATRSTKFSAYLSIFNDWDILPQALQSIAPYVDELVVVDGGYEWMAPFLQGIGKSLTRSAQPVYDCLEAAGLPYRIIDGTWKDEFEKRKAGYSACQHRYVFRIDADEIYFINEENLEKFQSDGAAVGDMEFPLYVSPDWILTHDIGTLERQSFLFDASQISADDHLYYLWLIDSLPPSNRPSLPVYPLPLSLTAHLTGWRTPTTSVNRAAFYVLNHFRHHGIAWYEDLRGKPLADLSALFARIPPAAFLDCLKSHPIVVGDDERRNRVLRPSPLSENQQARIAGLFDAFLNSQTANNAALAATGRTTLGRMHIDATTQAQIEPLCTGRTLALSCESPLRGGEAFVRYLVPRHPWEIVRKLALETAGTDIRIELPLGVDEPDFVRRFVVLEAWPSDGDPFLRFAPMASSSVAAETAQTSESSTQPPPVPTETYTSPPTIGFVAAGAELPPGHNGDETVPESAIATAEEQAKIDYVRRVREERIDPTTAHPLYRKFAAFLEGTEENPHYPKLALTMAEALNVVGDVFSDPGRMAVCETGTQTAIAQFLRGLGWAVVPTHSDLRYAIDADDGAFDIIFSLDMIQYLKDQHEQNLAELLQFKGSGARRYAEEIWRVAKPGGVVILTTPNPTSLSALFNLVDYKPPMIYRPHVREYTKSEIVEFFAKFELLKYRAFFAYSFLENGGRGCRRVRQAARLESGRSGRLPFLRVPQAHLHQFARLSGTPRQ